MRSILIVSAVLATLAACTASEGDRLITRGNAFTAVGQDLNKGEKLVKKGRKQIAKGQKQRRKGEGLVEKGEDNVAEGEKLIADARRRLGED